MGRETLVDWSTCPAAAAWVCSILQLQASRGQGVPAGAADSNSMDSRFPGCSSKPPSWQRLQAQHCTPATHLKYRIDRQQQSCPWVLRSNVEGAGGCPLPKLEEMCQSIDSGAAASRSLLRLPPQLLAT